MHEEGGGGPAASGEGVDGRAGVDGVSGAAGIDVGKAQDMMADLLKVPLSACCGVPGLGLVVKSA